MKIYIKPGGYAVLFGLTAVLAILIDRGVTSVINTMHEQGAQRVIKHTQTSQR